MIEKKKVILITGGAGYIGAFMVKRLMDSDFYPLILDDLSNGFAESLLYGRLTVGDIGNPQLVGRLLREYRVEDVIHFAGFASVNESNRFPEKYMETNFQKTRLFFNVCLEHNVRNIIYSSSCAVYGVPPKNPISENCPLNPINPYGESKKCAETALQKICRGSRMKYAILRYFNVAGADFAGRIGEMNAKNDRLIKIAAETAVGKRECMAINGTDYPTPDGTVIRDYIHVEDLVNAHLDTLHYLSNGGDSDTFNVGYGNGYSVKEIIDTVLRLSPRPFTVQQGERREGDPPRLEADASRIKNKTGWKPLYNDIEKIVATALQWEQHLVNFMKNTQCMNTPMADTLDILHPQEK